MTNQQFSTTFISLLSFGLGITTICLISSPNVQALPSSPTVSLGVNPIFSIGGNMGVNSTVTIVTAPADQQLIITDLALGISQDNQQCSSSISIVLTDSNGTSLGEFAVGNGHLYSAPVSGNNIHFHSGIPLAANLSLEITSDNKYAYCGTGSYLLHYTLSGYYAKP